MNYEETLLNKIEDKEEPVLDTQSTELDDQVPTDFDELNADDEIDLTTTNENDELSVDDIHLPEPSFGNMDTLSDLDNSTSKQITEELESEPSIDQAKDEHENL